MTEREATDAEMLAAVERWARARGILFTPTTALLAAGWNISIWPDGQMHVWYRSGQDACTIDGSWRPVDPHTALLWALSVEAGITVDVGRCPACVARSLPGRKLATTEWGIATAYGRTKPYIAHARYHPADGWLRGWGGKRRKGSSQWAQHHARPCPDCNGTGRDMREVAWLVLDAAPRGWVAAGEDCSPLCDDDCERCGRGDPQARDHIDVVADKLQGPGEPLGLWYALWLAGKRDDTADAVGHLHAAALRHELINYPGQSDDRTDAWTAAWELVTVPCERCEETGRVTTHHTPVPGANGEISFAALELPGPGPAARSRACPDCGGHGRVRS